jgi:imidazole glycerol-phosphate synthase subunit HisH
MISIIDLGAEDTDFLIRAIERSSEKFKITSDETEILRSSKVILTASTDIQTASRKLHLLNLYSILRICQRPMLGICAGMQLMGEHIENGSIPGLGLFPVKSENFHPEKDNNPYKGFHSISIRKETLLMSGIQEGETFYFCSSFFIPMNEYTTSIAANTVRFSASMERGHFFGVQFLPEKSGKAGMKVIQNFIEMPS